MRTFGQILVLTQGGFAAKLLAFRHVMTRYCHICSRVITIDYKYEHPEQIFKIWRKAYLSENINMILKLRKFF